MVSTYLLDHDEHHKCATHCLAVQPSSLPHNPKVHRFVWNNCYAAHVTGCGSNTAPLGIETYRKARNAVHANGGAEELQAARRRARVTGYASTRAPVEDAAVHRQRQACEADEAHQPLLLQLLQRRQRLVYDLRSSAVSAEADSNILLPFLGGVIPFKAWLSVSWMLGLPAESRCVWCL